MMQGCVSLTTHPGYCFKIRHHSAPRRQIPGCLDLTKTRLSLLWLVTGGLLLYAVMSNYCGKLRTSPRNYLDLLAVLRTVVPNVYGIIFLPERHLSLKSEEKCFLRIALANGYYFKKRGMEPQSRRLTFSGT